MLIYEAMKYAYAAYCNVSGKYAYLENKFSMSTIEDEYSFVYIIEYQDKIVCAFRGDEEEEKEINRNARKWGKKKNNEKNVFGFDKWNLIKKEVIQKIKKMEIRSGKNKKIYLIGHSLGGGMAILAGRDLKNEIKNKIEVIHFGTPNIFSEEEIEKYNKKGIKTTRIINGGDRITKYPKKKYNPGKIIKLRKKLFPLIIIGMKAHSPQMYLKAAKESNMEYWKYWEV